MDEPTLIELIGASMALIVIVVVAWKASSWLARRGHAVRPVTMMDYHMTRIEEQAADSRPKREAKNPGDGDLPQA